MNPAWRVILSSVMVVAVQVYAADPETTVEPAAPAAAEDSVTAEWRDPFWPVGYRPKAAKPVVTVKGTNINLGGDPGDDHGPASTIDWKGAFKKLQIKGTSRFTDRDTRKRKYQVLVNGRFLVEGDIIPVVHENQVYTFEVGHVTDKNVEMKKVGVRPQ